MGKRIELDKTISLGGVSTSFGLNAFGLPSIDIYFRGCDKKDKTGAFCKGCHNQDLWEESPKRINIDTVFNYIDKYLMNTMKFFEDFAITFMGGEPLAEYNRDAFLKLSERYKEVKQVLYTWREVSMIDEKYLKHINIVKTGEFDIDQVDSTYFLGSKNQYLFDVQENMKINGGSVWK
jgi:anaerobic ribonucleoside-triphosphate reductase activating protein